MTLGLGAEAGAGAVLEVVLALALVALVVRVCWAAGMPLSNGIAPRCPFHPALSAACRRRSSMSSKGGASRKRLPGDLISS